MQLPDRAGWRHLLATLAGAAGVLCFAPFGLFWLAPLVCLALFVLLRRTRTPREAALAGFCFGLGFFLAGVSWIYVSLSVFGGMAWWLAGPATVVFCAAMALYPALAGYLFKRWQAPNAWQQILLFAALMAAVDWLRSWIFTGFPWLALGYSQSPPSPLAGFSPLLGVFGVSLLVALAGASLLRWRFGIALIAILLVAGQALRQIEWTTPSGAPVQVALVQGNVPQETKFRPDVFLRTLRLYRDLIEAHPAQLTLIPETALPAFFEQLPPEYLEELANLARRQNGDLLVGALTGDSEAYFNSAISLGSAPTQVYRKQHLVPFGEFIPPGFAWFMAQANIPMSAFTPGAPIQAPLSVAGVALAVNICYEDVFGNEIIRSLPDAGILANLSNTAWFGRSLAQPQHLQIARMRAAETGRPMLRATNTGMTAIIDARGDLQAVLPAFETGVLRGEVRAHTGLTPYARYGNFAFLGLLTASLLISLWPLRYRASN